MALNATSNNISDISWRSILLVDGYVRFMVFNATFNNFSAVSRWPVSVVEEARVPERTTDHRQATGKCYHLRLPVECTLFCNLQSWARTHAVLVIGLYELLGNPTTLQKIGKPNIWKICESKKTKGPTQDSQNLLRIHMPEGDIP
jgi:hypothetical protein